MPWPSPDDDSLRQTDGMDVWVVAGEYNAYGDCWGAVAGVWATEAEAQAHLAALRSVPPPERQPYPNPREGHVRYFDCYGFDVVKMRVGEAADDFDPWKSLATLAERGWPQ